MSYAPREGGSDPTGPRVDRSKSLTPMTQNALLAESYTITRGQEVMEGVFFPTPPPEENSAHLPRLRHKPQLPHRLRPGIDGLRNHFMRPVREGPHPPTHTVLVGLATCTGEEATTKEAGKRSGWMGTRSSPGHRHPSCNDGAVFLTPMGHWEYPQTSKPRKKGPRHNRPTPIKKCAQPFSPPLDITICSS